MKLCVLFVVSCLAYQIRSQDVDVCHVYGDPHLIPFSQVSQLNQNGYWCKLSGEQQIVRNNFVEIKVNMHEGVWSIDKYTVTFFDNDKVLCKVTDHEQVCDTVRITRPSLTHIEMFYSIPELYISIVPYEYPYKWYDISILMPNELVRQSNGLCVAPSVDKCIVENEILSENSIPPMYKKMCEVYQTAGDEAKLSLNLPVDHSVRNHTLLACIHDIHNTNNVDFGASMVNTMVKDGIFKEYSNDSMYQFQVVESTIIIDRVIRTASITANAIFSTTTSVTTTDSTSQATPNGSLPVRLVSWTLNVCLVLLLIK
ncbi:unnamed protein product [Adineta ricciae]|uniref:Uncharacterized protein n=1 Tax=Adineta ricciae TaxID=249248 RepID=A0A815XP16_ADIRI|nr:unnamed protein product [Adineta ricciae]